LMNMIWDFRVLKFGSGWWNFPPLVLIFGFNFIEKFRVSITHWIEVFKLNLLFLIVWEWFPLDIGKKSWKVKKRGRKRAWCSAVTVPIWFLVLKIRKNKSKK
jgi:hypothetical protein